MTATTQTPDEIQAAARELYRQSVAAEMPLSGKQLGAQFGKGDRWGRLRIGEVKAETGSGTAQPDAERPGDAGRHGGTETGPERNSAGAADRHSGGGQTETEDELPLDEPDQDEDLSDTEPPVEPPADGGGAVPEPGSTVPDVGTGGGIPAAAGAADRPERAAAVPAVPVAVPHEPVAAAAVPGGIPDSVPVAVPGAATVPRSGRGLAWAAFLLGTAFSVAANVAHARPEWGARIAGAFWPVALILAVELMSRPIWRNGKRWAVARYGGTGLVAAVTAITSYWHMRGLLLTYGEDAGLAYIGPLAVDGLMIVAGFALLALTDRPDKV